MIGVLGGSGAIARALKDIERPKEYRFFSRDTSPDSGNNFDLSDSTTYRNVSNSDCETVLFLTALSSPSLCEQQPVESGIVNVEHTAKAILHLLRSGHRVLFASSDLVYSGASRAAYSESSSCKPRSVYGQQKLEIERKFESYDRFHSLRFSDVISRHTKYFSRVIRGRPDSFYSDVIRQPLCFQYLATLLRLDALEAIPKILNLAGEEEMSRYQIAKLVFDGSKMADLVGEGRLPKSSILPSVIRLDVSLLRKTLGVSPSIMTCNIHRLKE